MQITKEGISVLFDFEKLSLNKAAFHLLLAGDSSLEDNDTENISEKGDAEKDLQFIGPRKRPGRTPLYVKFPNLIACASEFIKNHSFSAHVRRRETTGTGAGVTLKEIQRHLLDNVPGLEESGGICRDTIHVMTVAPQKNHLRAKRYKNLIDARVPGKRNQYREKSANQHFLFARVKYREEFVSQHQEVARLYGFAI